jgi:PKD repeat protein
VAALAVAVGLAGCGLDEVKIPELSGPSVLGQSLRLTASPDVLVADGFSTSAVQIRLLGPDGQPIGGRAVTLLLADDVGNIASIGTLSADIAITNASGLAQVIYTAPQRTDNTANRSILVAARLIADDANGQTYNTVRIELRSAEPRFFPEVPGNLAPNCDFNVEPGPGGAFPGNQVLFKSLASDDDGYILRYEWDFGDGGTSDKPDVNHAFGFAGTYSVHHVVTDNVGAQSACSRDVVVN